MPCLWAMDHDFHGAKAALFIGDRLLCLLRDDRPDIPYPGLWDFPGGGREPGETPEETLAREIEEEVGLDWAEAQELWRMSRAPDHRPDLPSWFFVGRLPAAKVGEIRMGDEGQGWALMTLERFLALENAVPTLAPRLGAWIAAGGRVEGGRPHEPAPGT